MSLTSIIFHLLRFRILLSTLVLFVFTSLFLVPAEFLAESLLTHEFHTSFNFIALAPKNTLFLETSSNQSATPSTIQDPELCALSAPINYCRSIFASPRSSVLLSQDSIFIKPENAFFPEGARVLSSLSYFLAGNGYRVVASGYSYNAPKTSPTSINECYENLFTRSIEAAHKYYAAGALFTQVLLTPKTMDLLTTIQRKPSRFHFIVAMVVLSCILLMIFANL